MEAMITSSRESRANRTHPGNSDFFTYPVASEIGKKKMTISWETYTPRDRSRCNNGGDYYEWTRFWIGTTGSVWSYEISSYEDAESQGEQEYDVLLTWDGLNRLAEMAVRRVEAENTPCPLDIGKVRRRIEDALRKTAGRDDILAIAGLLGVDTTPATI